MNRSVDETRLEELDKKEREFYEMLGIPINESVKDLRETLTDLDCGYALRKSVINESFGAIGWVLESKKELGGFSFSQVRKKVPTRLLIRPFLLVGVIGEGLTASLALVLYLSGLQDAFVSFAIYLLLSSIIAAALCMRFFSVRQKIEHNAEKLRDLDNKLSKFIDNFGSSEEPYRLCDIDRSMKIIEDEGYEFNNELKARLAHLRELHANNPIGAVMV